MDLSISGIGARILRTRWVMRAPIWLYRVGAGWLLGGRLLMLEHIGRASGRRRFVCLEVVERPAPDRIVIVSGFGERSQWYRNLRAHPACVVSTGRTQRAPAQARFLSDDEAEDVLARYAERRPRDWEVLRAAIEKSTGGAVEHQPMVELVLSRRV